MNYSGSITDVSGITVGHYTDLENGTGCTVVLSDPPANAGMEVRGAAPGSRETALLDPLAGAPWVNGITLTGGSAFGLDSPGGVVRYLEEQGVGVNTGRTRIPLVPAAVVFDLGFINNAVRPTADDGYAAAVSASANVTTGNVGAGTGSTVGKLLGNKFSIKGGVGTASIRMPNGATVGALMVVNAMGGVVDPDTGEIIAGPQTEAGFANSIDLMIEHPPKDRGFFRNTTIGVVATDAPLDKIGAIRLAIAGQDGIALAIRPSHTANDGDTMFALSTGTHPDPVAGDVLHAAALKAVTGAILNAIESAETLGGIMSAADAKAAQTGSTN
ncbi:MAG TPA: peptidase S58 family protein [Dehalococcoidia bacterium]|jgi:L-aminopeptidase/D-esterase-like protein|nr:peptidase S58 family protein [Dehalococcoidia bacterium]